MTKLLEIKLQRISKERLKALQTNDENIAQKGYELSQKELGEDYRETNEVRYRTEF